MVERRGTDQPVGNRGVTPMVAKTLEAGIVVLFIGVVTTGLYAGVVPEYRSATAADVGERTLIAAGNEIERSVPPDATHVAAERRIDLPATIRSEEYRIAVDPPDPSADEPAPTVRLDHPHQDVAGSYALALPDHVVEVRGEWSGGDGRVVVRSVEDGVVVVLEDEP